MVSLKSIYPHTLQLNSIKRNGKYQVDDFVGESTLEEPFDKYNVRDKTGVP